MHCCVTTVPANNGDDIFLPPTNTKIYFTPDISQPDSCCCFHINQKIHVRATVIVQQYELADWSYCTGCKSMASILMNESKDHTSQYHSASRHSEWQVLSERWYHSCCGCCRYCRPHGLVRMSPRRHPKRRRMGTPMIACNADSGALMGLLYHYPPTSGKGGDEVDVSMNGIRGVSVRVFKCCCVPFLSRYRCNWKTESDTRYVHCCVTEISWNDTRGKLYVQRRGQYQ
jgi:hypothetical protein